MPMAKPHSTTFWFLHSGQLAIEDSLAEKPRFQELLQVCAQTQHRMSYHIAQGTSCGVDCVLWLY